MSKDIWTIITIAGVLWLLSKQSEAVQETIASNAVSKTAANTNAGNVQQPSLEAATATPPPVGNMLSPMGKLI